MTERPIRIIWHGEHKPTDAEREQTVEELRDLLDTGLARPSDLVFHNVFLDDDWGQGRQIIAWGKPRSPCFHAELHPRSEEAPR